MRFHQFFVWEQQSYLMSQVSFCNEYFPNTGDIQPFFVGRYNGVIASPYSNYDGSNNLLIHFKITVREVLNKSYLLLLLLLVSKSSLDSASCLGTKVWIIYSDIMSNNTSEMTGWFSSVIRFSKSIISFWYI